ncbi:glycerate kinase [Frigoribacterium faeni]|uniref:glycerate kinase n=1 Tax=Frigoribacterium faeni TaxID=145483 RepID=UPI00141B8F4F|nr:glycerate kinase [Frigoribacterium faeni]
MSIIVIAPDSFKGSASALEVCDALAAGWRQERPDDVVRRLPLADGGEGTLDAFAAVHEAERIPVEVRGPDDRPVRAHWLSFVDDAGRRTGVVELASTSGITLLQELQPWDAHTRGFGQAVRAALDAGVERLVLAVGGSSSTDGGSGLLAELGAVLLDADGRPVPDGLRGLGAVAVADLDRVRALPARTVVVCDVTSPLHGPTGAVVGFGAQKGLRAEDRAEAEAHLRQWAEVVGRARPADASASAPGAGAAGGVGFALTALGVSPGGGARMIAEALDLPGALAGADLVVTGEGRFDEQSAWGKVPGVVTDAARAAGVPVWLVAGSIAAPTEGFGAAAELTRLAGGAEAAMADPGRWLRSAGAQLARQFRAGVG